MSKNKMQKNLNPYFSEHGCEDRHDMAIDGYGITINSIKSWLYDNGLNTSIKFSKSAVNSIKASIDCTDDDIKEATDDELLQTATITHQDLVTFVTFSNRDDQLLMVYSRAVRADDDDLLPTANEVVKNIMIAINDLFEIPVDKINALTQYVHDHTDYVNMTDFS